MVMDFGLFFWLLSETETENWELFHGCFSRQRERIFGLFLERVWAGALSTSWQSWSTVRHHALFDNITDYSDRILSMVHTVTTVHISSDKILAVVFTAAIGQLLSINKFMR